MKNLSSDTVDTGFYTMRSPYLCFIQRNDHEKVGSKVFPGDPRLILSMCVHYNRAGLIQPLRLGQVAQ